MASEKALQDKFQLMVQQSTGRKVILWNKNHELMKCIRKNVEEKVAHKQILMQSDPELGVVGLIEGILKVNKNAFEELRNAWAQCASDPENQAGPVPSLDDLALAAALKFSHLWEQGMTDPAKITPYRVMLAYGGGFVWEKQVGVYGYDPRFLSSSDLHGWPKKLDPVYFYPLHHHEAYPFLDLDIPVWIDKSHQNKAVQSAEQLRNSNSSKYNSYTWVREFSVSTSGGRVEKADFTMFAHGLPLLWVEMKTEHAGLDSAASDFLTKQTYRGAPIRLLCDGRRAILTSQHDGNLELWNVERNPIGHGHGMPAADQSGVTFGQDYLLGQVLTKPERFEFLIRRASCVNAQGQFLVARPQQYQALARWMRELLWSLCSGQELSDRLIRHTQRTGKTHTMIRAIHLALAEMGGLGSAFNLAMLMVGEVTIIEQIAQAFTKGNVGLLDTPVSINKAESRQELKARIRKQHDQPNVKQVLLANTQKLESLDSMSAKYLSNLLKETGTKTCTTPLNPLVVIDESHLAQHGGIADTRSVVLPGAKHLLFTATPKDEMSQYYAIQHGYQVLGDFGYQQAVEAGVVVPVVFEHPKTIMGATSTQIDKLCQALELSAPQSLLETLDMGGNVLAADVLSPLARALLERLNKDLIEERLKAVVDRLDRIHKAIPLDERGQVMFHPRAMMFCATTDQARALIQYIQLHNETLAAQEGRALTDAQRNVFMGLRFGMDVSDFGHGDDHTLSKMNPGIHDHATIKSRFESDEPDTAINVLVVVGKYTKGYDNPNLCLVALLRNIKELSLINQITTRPATKRKGKASGVCLDLTLGQSNVQSWRSSLSLYDKGTDVPLFDEQGVDKLHQDLQSSLSEAAQVIDPSWTQESLGVGENLSIAIDQLKADSINHSAGPTARAFIKATDAICSIIQKIPDATVWSKFKQPLLGVKFILKHIRLIFPDLDASDTIPEEATSLRVIDPKTLGQHIDAALNVLNAPTLKDFLDIRQLQAQVVDGVISESQAVQEARLNIQAENAAATARALLGLPTSRAPKENQGQEEEESDPSEQLRRALEAALKRLTEAQQEVEVGLSPMERIQEMNAQVNIHIRKFLDLLGPKSLSTIMIHEVEREFTRRWELLGLAGASIPDVFKPLIEMAGSQWASQFEEWRSKMGSSIQGQMATCQMRSWISVLVNDGGNINLAKWVTLLMKTNPNWAREFVVFSTSHKENAADVRAAMGNNEATVITQDMPFFVETAAMNAAHTLEKIEAYVAWERITTNA